MKERVLVIRFSALGDIAMLSPIVRQYALEHPDDSITVLSRPFCAPLFEDIAPNVCFLGKDINNDYKGLRGLYRLFRELHAMHFDRIVDCHDVLRTKVLRLFFKKHRYPVSTIDKHRSLRRQLTAPQPRKQLTQLPTAFQNYWEAITGESRLSRVSIVSRDSREYSSKLFGVAPFAAHEGKIYPLHLMEQVVALLSAKGTVILFGGKGKEEYTMRAWAQKYNNVFLAKDPEVADIAKVSSSPNAGLSYELDLMRRLTVMLSMDSANMHLASLVGTRVVSIWGATHPYAGFLGWQQSPEDCIQLDMPCRPCSIYGNKPCIHKDHRCMTQIKPETIVKAVIPE